MESVGSNSPDPPPTRHRRHHKPPAQALAERIGRALRHPLLLLHRSDSTFYIMGSTSNVYTVVLTVASTCSCPDRATPCKHILFVLIRVLGVPPEYPSLLLHHRHTLRPCQLSGLLATPTSPDSLADPALRHRFHQIFFSPGNMGGGLPTAARPRVEAEEGACCPVCLEEMGGGKALVACRRCRNPVHEQCLMRWKRSQGRRWASCVICRARWRNAAAAATDKYLNLAAYRNGEEGRAEVAVVEGGSSGGCGGG